MNKNNGAHPRRMLKALVFHPSSFGCLEGKEEIYHAVVLTGVGLLRVRPSSEDI